MRKIIIVTAAAVSLLPAAAWAQANIRPDPNPRVPPQPGQTLPVEDALFLKEAALASQGQVELGQLAVQKAEDESLRAIAEQIAQTHARLSDELKKLAGSRSLPPADQLQPEVTDRFGAAGAVSNPENAREGMAQEAIRSLSELGGAAFGKAYVVAQLRLHQRLADLYQTQASHTPDPEGLGAFAIKSLVLIQKDRDTLRQVAERFGIDADAEGQPVQYGDPAQARQ